MLLHGDCFVAIAPRNDSVQVSTSAAISPFVNPHACIKQTRGSTSLQKNQSFEKILPIHDCAGYESTLKGKSPQQEEIIFSRDPAVYIQP